MLGITSESVWWLRSLWLKSRPCKRPRGVSSILIGIIYRPNNTKDANVLEQHIIDICDDYLVSHPNAGIIILGDFNRMNTKPLERKLGVKQIVNLSTRGGAALDFILTNVQEYYCDPTQLPPFGRSDHNASLYKPKQFSAPSGAHKVIRKRKLNNSNLSRLYDQLNRQNWTEIYLCNYVEEKTTRFYDIVISTLDQTVPFKSYRIHTNDKPISIVILKEMSSLLAPPLMHIFNFALIDGHFPAHWKRADVCPVPKTSRAQDPEKELRQISLTSPVGKVFERHLYSLLLQQVGWALLWFC